MAWGKLDVHRMGIPTRVVLHHFRRDEVVLDKHLLENTLDTIEIFIEDTEVSFRGTSPVSSERKVAAADKPQVTRLN